MAGLSMEQAQSLLNFEQPLNVGILDAVMQYMTEGASAEQVRHPACLHTALPRWEGLVLPSMGMASPRRGCPSGTAGTRGAGNAVR